MTSAEGWLDYWSGDISVYVSRRHLAAHYRRLFAELAPLLPAAPFRLLDYGCGEALMAPRLAEGGSTVHLVDEAPGRAAQLSARFAAAPGVTVLDRPEQVAGSCDVALMISVSQYIPKDRFPDLLARLAGALKPDGRLIVGDILPPENSLVADVSSLLRFAAAEGFFVDAAFGMIRTFRSTYRSARHRLGLTTWHPDEIVAAFAAAGLEATPLARNIGHSARRYSMLARRRS
jgi:SAM-dependent methyltransferase